MRKTWEQKSYKNKLDNKHQVLLTSQFSSTVKVLEQMDEEVGQLVQESCWQQGSKYQNTALKQAPSTPPCKAAPIKKERVKKRLDRSSGSRHGCGPVQGSFLGSWL